MGYLLKAIIGAVLFIGGAVLFNVELVELLEGEDPGGDVMAADEIADPVGRDGRAPEGEDNPRGPGLSRPPGAAPV